MNVKWSRSLAGGGLLWALQFYISWRSCSVVAFSRGLTGKAFCSVLRWTPLRSKSDLARENERVYRKSQEAHLMRLQAKLVHCLKRLIKRKTLLTGSATWPASREDPGSFLVRYVRIKSHPWASGDGLYLQSRLQSVREEVGVWTWENRIVFPWKLMLPRGMWSIQVVSWVGANVSICLRTHTDGWEKQKAPHRVSFMRRSSWAEIVGRLDRLPNTQSLQDCHPVILVPSSV